jgi:hypothetical protein
VTTIGPTIDLGALARHLAGENRHRRLVGAIEKVVACHSLRSDLDIARETLDALDGLLSVELESRETKRRIVEHALLCSAVVLYARATKTTSRSRRGFDPRAQFSDAQKAVHREICDLRDDAIAHFGTGGTYQGEWQSETAILQCLDGRWKVGTTTRRLSVDKPLTKRLRRQIDAALGIIQAEYRRRNDAVAVALDEANADPEFASLLTSFPMDLGAFLKDPDAAVKALRGFHDGGLVKGSSAD